MPKQTATTIEQLSATIELNGALNTTIQLNERDGKNESTATAPARAFSYGADRG
jgi:hypothetical protein